MKLTSRSDLVKPDRTVLMVAVAAVALTALTLLAVVASTDPTQRRIDHFGAATSRALAEVVVEPISRRDRLHLGVIGNRLAEAPEIVGVASFDAENTLLASTGESSGDGAARSYAHDVRIDGHVIGHVSVLIDPGSFAIDTRSRLLGWLATIALMPLLIAVAVSLIRAGRRGDLDDLLPRWPVAAEPPAIQNEQGAEHEDTGNAVSRIPEPDVVHYLLAVNLYNQLTLQADEREFELSLCIELGEAVAEIFQGQVVALPGVGALLDLDDIDDDDRPFQAVCAGLLLARLLRDEAPFGRYRVGLNLIRLPGDETLRLDDDAVADAALLSALARDNSLAVSESLAECLHGSERFAARTLANPLLEELRTSGPNCLLITELEGPFAIRLAQQAEQLRSQRDAMSNPSTF